MECFFACLLDMPDHSIPDYALLQNVILLVLGQIQKSLVTNMPNIQSCEPNNIQIGIFVYIFPYYASHHEAILICFASVPADLFIFCLDRLQHHNR